VLVVDGDSPLLDLAVMGAAWRGVARRPAIVVLASSGAARVGAERIQATVVAKPYPPEALVRELARVGAAPQGVVAPTATQALRVLGMAGGGLADDEAAAILAGSRHVDLELVREALRPHAMEYAARTTRLETLIHRRALQEAEARFAITLDGADTMRRAIDGGRLDQAAAARLMWALVCGGAVVLTPEPPDDEDHPRARRVARARDELRARRDRMARAAAHDVLEVEAEAAPAEIERAAQLLALKFAPDRVAGLDLGDLAGLVEPLWTQVLRARAALLAPKGPVSATDQLFPALEPEKDERRAARRADLQEAEAAFVRGQHALSAGDAFKAMSELAAAARRRPEEPDYEVYAAWARVCAEHARGHELAPIARRERDVAIRALAGRRPRARALFALGLLCEAAGDTGGAIDALGEALACDPRLTPARQLLARLAGAREG
jgi:hypothetical protein